MGAVQECKNLYDIIKPYKDFIESQNNQISNLSKENSILKSKYEMIKRGIPFREVELMYNEQK